MLKFMDFDLSQMLNALSKYAKEVKIESVGSGNWRVYVLSDKHGEFEHVGSLNYSVYLAFKPFIEIAKTDRDRQRNLLEKIAGWTK